MMVLFLFLSGLLSLSHHVYSTEILAKNVYDNHTLIQLIPHTQGEFEAARLFEDPSGRIEILKRSRGQNDSLDVLVPPDQIEYVHDYADAGHLEVQVKKEHYGRRMLDPARTPKRRVLRNRLFEYNSYDTMLNMIDAVQQKSPELVTVQTLGSSYWGKPLKLVKISSDPEAGNPIILIDAAINDSGIHAREWVAPAMALYLIHRLTTDPEAKKNELKGLDWYIIPLVNPDGYEFTRSNPSNRMWRKTRSKSKGNCFGVDGNRNYGFKWAVSGVSTNPCDRETYAGPAPFSEPETKAVRKAMAENAKRIKLYVSLHAYGQYLVYPWGYTGTSLPKDWEKLDKMARLVSDSVQKAGGKKFQVLSAGQWYPAAGGSDDYAFGAIGVPYSYTMELTDGFEFDYPEYLLSSVLPQFYQGFRTFGQQIKKEFGGALSPNW